MKSFKKGDKVWFPYEWTYFTGKVEEVKYNGEEIQIVYVRTDCGNVRMEITPHQLTQGKCPFLKG